MMGLKNQELIIITVTFEACRKCANKIESSSRLDKYNITVPITFRVAVCIDAL